MYCEKNEKSNQKCYRESALKLCRPHRSGITDKVILRLRLWRGFAPTFATADRDNRWLTLVGHPLQV